MNYFRLILTVSILVLPGFAAMAYTPEHSAQILAVIAPLICFAASGVLIHRLWTKYFFRNSVATV